MQLEQQMEQSEALLETNEQNKKQLEEARERTRRANNNANAAMSHAQHCQNRLRQAEAARSAAQQRASEEDGESVSASYDEAVEEAESELREAMEELQRTRMELAEAQERERSAEGALEESTRELQNVARELQQVSERYGVEMGKTQALMNLPYAQISSQLMQQLGIGRGRVDELRQRIAASLGISASAGGMAGGGYGGLAGSRSRGRGNTIGGGGGGVVAGGGGTGSSRTGRPSGSTSGGSSPTGTAGPSKGAGAAPVMNKPSRPLSQEERASLQADTGWTEKQLKKCTIDEDGVIHYRTDNYHKEGSTSKTGVPYVRRQISLFGRTVEGVFPVFHSYQDVQLPSHLERASPYRQFDHCNQELKKRVAEDPELRAQFTEDQLDDIENGETPDGFVWHHNEEQGRMQLTRSKDHDRTQEGAAHTGGQALWCGRMDGAITGEV